MGMGLSICRSIVESHRGDCRPAATSDPARRFSSACRCIKGQHAVDRPHNIASQHASSEEPIVYVVDDDASVRGALSNLFRSVGLRVEVFGSAPEFLQSKLIALLSIAFDCRVTASSMS